MAAPRRFALIPAAGTSARFGERVPKQYAPIAGVPLLRRTIDSLHGATVLEVVFVESIAAHPSDANGAWTLRPVIRFDARLTGHC